MCRRIDLLTLVSFCFSDFVIPLTSSGKPRKLDTSIINSSPAIVYPTIADETLVLPPYIISLLPSTTTTNHSSPSLSIHSLDTLRSIQNVDILHQSGRPLSRTESQSSNTPTTSSTSDSFTTAKFLTTNFTSSQPPLLLLTTTNTDQTIWIVNMQNWQLQIEELGQQGEWEEGIKLYRNSGPGGGELLVSEILTAPFDN